MTATEQKERAADRVRELAHRGLDVAAFWRECDAVIAPVVPFMLRPCWFTLDPDSLLTTSHYDAAVPSLPPGYLAHEYADEPGLTVAGVARSRTGAMTVHQATGGDPTRSTAWQRFVQPYGGDQQLFVALRTRGGAPWGVLTLYREPDRPMFTEEDTRFLRALSADLADGARRGLLLGEALEPEGPNTPVLIVLDERWQVQSMTPGAESMLGRLPGGDSWRTRGRVPPVVLSVAGRALSHQGAAEEGATARVLSENGTWLAVHGAPLLRDHDRAAAVIIEPADPDRISPLLMAAYGLTPREKDVTRLVLRGESTAEIAAALFLSPETVQQHLKNVFGKAGVHSRRELTSKVFFAHYEPRMRDNDERNAAGRPYRGGPLAG